MTAAITELPQDLWLEDFQRSFVDGIDADLIHAMVVSLSWAKGDNVACSVSRMMDICNDRGKWAYPTKSNEKRKRTPYWRLRKLADFLGLPPWLLLRTDYNVLLYTLFQLKSAKFDEYPLIDFARSLSGASTHLNVARMTQNDREQLRRDLTRIASDFYTMTRRGESDTAPPDSLFDLCQRVLQYIGEFSFSVEVPIPTQTGDRKIAHLRLIQGIFPEFKSQQNLHSGHMWQCAWMSVVLDAEVQKIYESGIDEVVRLISKPFEAYPLKFTKTDDGKVYLVYSWHSLRSRLLSASTKDQIESKLSKVPLTMNELVQKPDHDATIHFSPNLFAPEESIKLVQWMSKDVPQKFRPSVQDIRARFSKRGRRQNSIELLFDVGYLQVGTVLEFALQPVTNGEICAEDPTLTCLVAVDNGKPCVIWNSESYSITGLTRTLLQTQNWSMDFDHLNGNRYWRKRGDKRALFQVANEMVRLDKDQRVP